jgi:hypothetical protein
MVANSGDCVAIAAQTGQRLKVPLEHLSWWLEVTQAHLHSRLHKKACGGTTCRAARGRRRQRRLRRPWRRGGGGGVLRRKPSWVAEPLRSNEILVTCQGGTCARYLSACTFAQVQVKLGLSWTRAGCQIENLTAEPCPVVGGNSKCCLLPYSRAGREEEEAPRITATFLCWIGERRAISYTYTGGKGREQSAGWCQSFLYGVRGTQGR